MGKWACQDEYRRARARGVWFCRRIRVDTGRDEVYYLAHGADEIHHTHVAIQGNGSGCSFRKPAVVLQLYVGNTNNNSSMIRCDGGMSRVAKSPQPYLVHGDP